MRRLLKHFFRNRDCVTMIRPVECEEKLQQLESLDESQLRQEFVNQLRECKQKIFQKVGLKSIKGRVVNGATLLTFTEALVESIN